MPEQNYAVATVPLPTPGDRWASGKLLEIWPETPILPKPLFSWRRLPM